MHICNMGDVAVEQTYRLSRRYYDLSWGFCISFVYYTRLTIITELAVSMYRTTSNIIGDMWPPS
jgi:hypothetical protein